MKDGAYRVFAKGFKVGALDTTFDTKGSDEWQGLRGGVRADWDLPGSKISFSSEANTSHQGQTLIFPQFAPPYTFLSQQRYTNSDWFVQGKWEQTAGPNKGTSVRASLEHYDRGTADIGERNTNYAIDFQKPIPSTGKNHVIWGLGLTSSDEKTFATPYAHTVPVEQTITVYSGFIHDETELSKKLRLSLGTKFEHNSFTGWEIQPSARMSYQPSENQTFWGAISRAVRTPSITDQNDALFGSVGPGPGGLPLTYEFFGSPNQFSEVEISHELGWRYETNKGCFFDATLFLNEYSDLRNAVYLGATPVTTPFPYVQGNVQFRNGASAQTGGFELAAHQALRPTWRLDESYSLYTESFNPGTGNVLEPIDLSAGTAPRHQFSVRSQLDLPKKMEFDVASYYVSGIPAQNIAPYLRVDLRFGWKPNEKTDISVGVANLANYQHQEAVANLWDVSSQVRRSLYGQVTFRF
jgi:iron complex outermembrane receptor protein